MVITRSTWNTFVTWKTSCKKFQKYNANTLKSKLLWWSTMSSKVKFWSQNSMAKRRCCHAFQFSQQICKLFAFDNCIGRQFFPLSTDGFGQCCHTMTYFRTFRVRRRIWWITRIGYGLYVLKSDNVAGDTVALDRLETFILSVWYTPECW